MVYLGLVIGFLIGILAFTLINMAGKSEHDHDVAEAFRRGVKEGLATAAGLAASPRQGYQVGDDGEI